TDRRTLTGTGLIHLKELPRLSLLNLRDTGINKAGMEAIRELRSLQRLDLFRTPVGDKELPALHGMKDLQHLALPFPNEQLTPRDLADLRKALPTTRITSER